MKNNSTPPPAERDLRERCLEMAVRANAANAVQLATSFLGFVKGDEPTGPA
jgi:hypothetical protein